MCSLGVACPPTPLCTPFVVPFCGKGSRQPLRSRKYDRIVPVPCSLMTSWATPICSSSFIIFSPVRAASMAVFDRSAQHSVQDGVPGFSSMAALGQAMDVNLSRRMRTSHKQVTDSKNLICFTTTQTSLLYLSDADNRTRCC